MAAVCVQAIWTASAPSISSFGAAASIIASAAFIDTSEMPPKGERHAACIWNSAAFVKSLDVVPRALLSRGHQFSCSPSGGWTFASLPFARHTLTRTGGRRRWPATGIDRPSLAASFGCPVVGKGLHERSEPPPLLNSVCSPVASFKISVFAATWRAWAQSTVETTPSPITYRWAFAR